VDGDRVAHVHLKDVEAAIAARLRSRTLTLMEAVQAGVFRPLGDGDARIDDVLRGLNERPKRGTSSPARSTRRSSTCAP
jgi:inosose dehydratase